MLQTHAIIPHLDAELVPSPGAGITFGSTFSLAPALSVDCSPGVSLGPDQLWDQANWPALVSLQFPWFWEVSPSLRLVSVVVLKTTDLGSSRRKADLAPILFRSSGTGKVSSSTSQLKIRSKLLVARLTTKREEPETACSTQVSTWQENVLLMLWKFLLFAFSGFFLFPGGHLNYRQMFTL